MIAITGTSTELHPRSLSPAPLQMKGTPATGIHSGPIVESRPDKPKDQRSAISITLFVVSHLSGEELIHAPLATAASPHLGASHER